ncbi:hypothetical protein B0J14DRAFT_653507 [Halenospora varia]|nr:hypothetical protein B0J14DRAFT_653507 [Halenospora varia]
MCSDPLAVAKQAERELTRTKQSKALTIRATLVFILLPTSQGYVLLIHLRAANESGVDQSVENRFPGASVTYGSAASGGGDNREIPESEGDVGKHGQPTKARDFEGTGGPEDEADIARRERGGDDGVSGNVRQGGGDDGSVRVPGGQ